MLGKLRWFPAWSSCDAPSGWCFQTNQMEMSTVEKTEMIKLRLPTHRWIVSYHNYYWFQIDWLWPTLSLIRRAAQQIFIHRIINPIVMRRTRKKHDRTTKPQHCSDHGREAWMRIVEILICFWVIIDFLWNDDTLSQTTTRLFTHMRVVANQKQLRMRAIVRSSAMKDIRPTSHQMSEWLLFVVTPFVTFGY